MRIDLLVLSALAALALAALIDAARRAAPGADDGSDHDVSSGVVPRARIEALERALSQLDDHAARSLIAAGLGAAILGLTGHVLGVACVEVAAVMMAAGLGLALPGASWCCDVHRRRSALLATVEVLRNRATMLERSRGGRESGSRARVSGCPKIGSPAPNPSVRAPCALPSGSDASEHSCKLSGSGARRLGA